MTPEQANPPRQPGAPPPLEPGWRAYPPPPPRPSRFRSWLVYSLLMSSLVANFFMYVEYQDYFSAVEGPNEKFHSGNREAADKIAIVRVSGTIMPPFTERVIKAIKRAREDEKVKGVLLSVNSPGGLVADSHEIYHELQKVVEKKKPVYVSMKSLAASGGYYISMGAGPEAKIYAEPTTWTGSIGVIVPHYDASGLAEKIGVRVEPLKTGEFKDALSPFHPISDAEKALWENIIQQSFDQFLEVIDENRSNLTLDQVRALATGQIYTAKDAKANGLVDEIGYEEEALAALEKKLGLTKARIVTFEQPMSLVDALLSSADPPDAGATVRLLLEASVPRAMYFFSWGALPALPR